MKKLSKTSINFAERRGLGVVFEDQEWLSETRYSECGQRSAVVKVPNEYFGELDIYRNDEDGDQLDEYPIVSYTWDARSHVFQIVTLREVVEVDLEPVGDLPATLTAGGLNEFVKEYAREFEKARSVS